MDYSALNHKLHFICGGRFTSNSLAQMLDRPQWIVHIDDLFLGCNKRKLRAYRSEVYGEIIVDLKATKDVGITQVYLFRGGQWEGKRKDIDDVGLCRQCKKKLSAYVNHELNIPADDLIKLFATNKKEIAEAFLLDEYN